MIEIHFRIRNTHDTIRNDHDTIEEERISRIEKYSKMMNNVNSRICLYYKIEDEIHYELPHVIRSAIKNFIDRENIPY